MVGFILCLWFNLDMVSPSSPNHPKGFGRIALVGKYQADGIADHLHELAKLALGRGCEVFLEAETAKNTQINDYPHKKVEDFAGSIDLAIVLGGDGTMLGIGRQLAGSKVPLVGVNLGRLGYMTDIPIQDVKTVLTEIIAGHYEADERTLLDAAVLRDGKVINRALALNDVVVNRSGISLSLIHI